MEITDCKKTPVGPSDFESRLSTCTEVLITKGKKLLRLDPKTDGEEILAQAIGRSGTLRAPTTQQGELLIVGFSEEAYSQLSS